MAEQPGRSLSGTPAGPPTRGGVIRSRKLVWHDAGTSVVTGGWPGNVRRTAAPQESLRLPQRRGANSAVTRARRVVQQRPTSGQRSVVGHESLARALHMPRRTNNPTWTPRSTPAG
jgi:hypothetical protein